MFDLSLRSGQVKMDKISRIEIRLPNSASFDTYSLKDASQDEIRQWSRERKHNRQRNRLHKQ